MAGMVTGMETVQEEECGWRERVGGQKRIAVRQKKRLWYISSYVKQIFDNKPKEINVTSTPPKRRVGMLREEKSSN